MAFAGAPEAAARALAPFRALATPLADYVQAGSYSSMFMPEAFAERPAAAVRSRLTNRLGLAEAQAMLDHVKRSDAPMRLGEIRVLGGAAARVPEAATAFAHRQSRFMVSFIALFDSADAPARHNHWATEGITALRSGDDDDRVYVNFLAGDGAERLRAAYPAATLERLRRVKRLYDPENLFRLNHNISPS